MFHRGECKFLSQFDTWFFLSLITNPSELNNKLSPQDEAYDPRWLSPKDALSAYESGDIFLAPPTRSILERMANTSSLEEMLTFVDKPLKPIEPFFVDSETTSDTPKKFLVLPGDPLHHNQVRCKTPMHTRYRFP